MSDNDCVSLPHVPVLIEQLGLVALSVELAGKLAATTVRANAADN
jgi:hypothetical protein